MKKPRKILSKFNSVNSISVAVILIVFVLFVWSNLFNVKVEPNYGLLVKLGLAEPTPVPAEELNVAVLSEIVTPEEGYTVNLNWGDTGQKLVAAGGIDMEKYMKNYDKPEYKELLSYLTENKGEGITINKQNAYFWVNTLWALGLTQKSDVLDKGVMGTEYADRVGSFASTGGWTLGAKDAVSLYSSGDIIPLTQEQQDLVTRVSANVYRPCCGNPTSFPDCNHGMAILGLLELMASQGATEEEMYEASLAFNSYWFGQTYIDLAYYFQTEKGLSWDEVDPKLALSAEFSSAPGYQTIKQEIGNIPGSKQVGASCGA